jgi:hypothetical protein
MKTTTKPKYIKLINPLNGEEWICGDYTDVKYIDGVEYIKVQKFGNERTHLMRKDALRKK